jgi:outer membrane autotransporter protein
MQRKNFSLTPTLNVGVSELNGESMNESGVGTPNASLASSSETHAWLEPAVALGFQSELANRRLLRAYARFGVVQYLTESESEVRAGLVDAPPGVEPMQIISDLDRTQFVAEGGFELISSDQFTLGLSYATQNSELRDTDTGTLRIWFPLD